MADQKPLVLIAGVPQQIPAADKIPVSSLASGTPTGAKFIRDDGVLAVPSGSGMYEPMSAWNGGAPEILFTNTGVVVMSYVA